MTYIEFFATAAFWLGAVLIVAVLLLCIQKAAWALVQDFVGVLQLCRLLIACREVGGIDVAIDKLLADRE